MPSPDHAHELACRSAAQASLIQNGLWPTVAARGSDGVRPSEKEMLDFVAMFRTAGVGIGEQVFRVNGKG